jgi:hypothetical protein
MVLLTGRGKVFIPTLLPGDVTTAAGRESARERTNYSSSGHTHNERERKNQRERERERERENQREREPERTLGPILHMPDLEEGEGGEIEENLEKVKGKASDLNACRTVFSLRKPCLLAAADGISFLVSFISSFRSFLQLSSIQCRVCRAAVAGKMKKNSSAKIAYMCLLACGCSFFSTLFRQKYPLHKNLSFTQFVHMYEEANDSCRY